MTHDLESQLPEDSTNELFEHAPCGYLCTRPDGTVANVNATFLALTGYDRNALLAGIKFRDLLTTPGRVYHDTHFGPLLQMQRTVKEVAFDLLRPAKDPLPVLVNAANKRAPDGKVLLTWITVFDASDRRQYERELLAARKKAEDAVEKERLARDLAEQASRAKDDFLALVSHELRTPLNAILGWVQILKSDAAEPGDLAEGLDTIERNARVQVQLVADLLDMGRITSGKMRLDVQRVDLAAILSDALETIRPAADAKAIRLQKILDPTVTVSGDPGRLQQVFWNLLTNAIKFTPKDGFVRVVMQRVNSHIEVSLTDSGLGMKPEFLAKAFQKFSQSDTAGNRKIGGLGLGLSLVKQLVEMHGGSVSASSPGEGRGSTFLVNLPLAAVDADHVHRAHPRPAITDDPVNVSGISLARVRVLVVDDEEDARELLRRLLLKFHADVTTAASADEALALIERVKPHVLISDIGLGEDDGYELIRRVRMLGHDVAATRALALTAFSRLEDRTRAMLAGYQMHIAKPVEPAELIVTVANLAGLILPDLPPHRVREK